MKKEKVYKEDSTKGRSLINPVSYKGDVMVQVWMDSRVLATLCKWLESEGEYPRFLSHVVRTPLEMLADSLVEEGKIGIVDDTLDARTLLQGRFHVNLNKGKKGMKNLLHNITLSSRRGTDLGVGTGDIDYTRHEEPKRLSQEDANARYYKKLAEIRNEYPELSIEEQRAKAREELSTDYDREIENDKKKARECGLTVENVENRQEEISKLTEVYHEIEANESAVVKEGMDDEEYAAKMKEIKKRDLERVQLEKNSMISEDDIVSGN